MGKSNKSSPKLKLDQGYKSLLRGLRKSFFAAFEQSGLSTGFHHFNEEKWLIAGEKFLQYLGF